MYDRYLNTSNEYNKFNCMVNKILNGETVNYSTSWLKKIIYKSYQNNRLQSWQYDHLIGRLEEIELF